MNTPYTTTKTTFITMSKSNEVVKSNSYIITKNHGHNEYIKRKYLKHKNLRKTRSLDDLLEKISRDNIYFSDSDDIENNENNENIKTNIIYGNYVCVCDCNCREQKGYDTLAPYKVGRGLLRKNVFVCQHFASCAFSGKTCKKIL